MALPLVLHLSLCHGITLNRTILTLRHSIWLIRDGGHIARSISTVLFLDQIKFQDLYRGRMKSECQDGINMTERTGSQYAIEPSYKLTTQVD